MQHQFQSERAAAHPAAAVWGAGGKAYDLVSFAISDALAHAGQRLAPRPGEAVLDVGTGTGWSARNAARFGARLTGVDIAPTLLQAAADLSAHVDPPIGFICADAEDLPFADGAFDRVVSTFGVMFARNPTAAARELGRVCRPGGRLCVAAWVPGGSVADFFAVIGAHDPSPPPPTSPLDWGDPEKVEALLGDWFELAFERGTSHAYHDDVQAIWDWYLAGFGPLRSLHDGLGPEGRAALRRDVDRYHRHYETPSGLHVTRDYLLAIGTRRRE